MSVLKERYLWIYADSPEVIIFKNNIDRAAELLGWPRWRVEKWRRNKGKIPNKGRGKQQTSTRAERKARRFT